MPTKRTTRKPRRLKTDAQLERIARGLTPFDFARLTALWNGGIGWERLRADIAHAVNRRRGPHKSKLGKTPAQIRDAHVRITALYLRVIDKVDLAARGKDVELARFLLYQKDKQGRVIPSKWIDWKGVTLEELTATIKAATLKGDPAAHARQIVKEIEARHFSGERVSDRYLLELTRLRKPA